MSALAAPDPDVASAGPHHAPDLVASGGEVSACDADSCLRLRQEASDPLLPEAQRRWAARALPERLAVVRRARHLIATRPRSFAEAISPALARTQADTLVTELLPLLDAMRFLERNAHRLLAPRRLGSRGRPLWLTGVQAEIHRDPLGHVLVIAPANFPLFLPGVQAMQALVAGNAVTWKPGEGGEAVALLLAHTLREAGVPRGVLRVADASVEAAQEALAQRPDKVVFTGSFDTGKRVLAKLAETATPATMELSGADAVVVLPSADLPVTARAVAFGLRLNGGEVCMSPRRLFATRETLNRLRPLLEQQLTAIPARSLTPRTATLLTELLRDAVAHGAERVELTTAEQGAGAPAGEARASSTDDTRTLGSGPVLLDRVTPHMAIARTDIFAPVLSLIEVPSTLHLPDAVNDCPYALTAAIFGDPGEARTLAAQLRVGTVLVNDLIAPTADPRVPFGGRGHSGFGSTRGAEGLMEMTAAKTLLLRRKPFARPYDPVGKREIPLFTALIGALHGSSFRARWGALQQLMRASRAQIHR
jgi:acyl-CoA reductase-like NAD-dependent aldehyde dehydrogenase